MEIKILKFTKSDNLSIKYFKEINNDGEFSVIDSTDIFREIPHNDLSECVLKILNFYNAISSKNYKEEVNTTIELVGRVLAKRILRTWNEDFVDEDTGDIVSIERNEIVFDSNHLVTKDDISEIVVSGNESFTVYKEGQEIEETTEPLFTEFKSIQLYYDKSNRELEGFKLELIHKDNCPLTHEGKFKSTTSKVFLNKTYVSFFHIEIQNKFIELINKLNFELLEYMKGKNGLPEQTKLF